jgi:dTDP-4-amino-4,6-dideoxygalactose transaminase
MHVSTFQGLGVGDLVHRAGHVQTFPFSARHQVRFYRARNAIYHLFRALGDQRENTTVLVPDYNSGNEILALRAAGATPHFYPVGPDGQADPAVVASLCEKHAPGVLSVIHYLGWPQPMEELVRICRRRGMLLVEDCALALLSELDGQPLGSFGDFAVYCLYKTLPVPNGAILVQNTERLNTLEHLEFEPANLASAVGRTAELLVQRVRGRMDGLGAALEVSKRYLGRTARALEFRPARVGDIGFSMTDVNVAMSPITERLLERLDYDDIRRTRAENFRQLAAELGGRAPVLHREIADGTCPLFFPLLVSNKSAAATALRARGIDVLEFWNQGADSSDAYASASSRYLRSHVLGLPVHQDLTPRHMSHIARHVTQLNLSEPS